MASVGEVIRVKGIALRSGISRNNVTYTSEEMNKTAGELANKPFFMDHESLSTGVIVISPITCLSIFSIFNAYTSLWHL